MRLITQLYVTETSELHGCIIHGDSHTDAFSNIKEAIDLLIKHAKEFDDPVPKQNESEKSRMARL